MKVVVVIRHGEEKLRVAAAIRNGVLRSGDNILINADRIAESGLTKDYVMGEIKAHRISPEIEALGMRIGDNGNGLICRWLEDIEEERRQAAKAAYDALPAEVRAAREEREAISNLYARADRSLNYDTDEDNVSRGYSLRAEADRRLAAWRVQYPHQAKEEERSILLAQAAKRRDLAAGALIYDADGWISPDEQQRRHDEIIREAEEIEAQAAKL